MKGKIFTILFSMLVFVAFAATPPTPPPALLMADYENIEDVIKSDVHDIYVIDMGTVNDHVPDIGNTIPIVNFYDPMPSIIDARDPLPTISIYNELNSDIFYRQTYSNNRIPKNHGHHVKPYDPGSKQDTAKNQPIGLQKVK